MKQEDKELLLKDLCARLPYKVKAQFPDKYGGYTSVIESVDIDGYVSDSEGNIFEVDIVKPYLFPLSSMNSAQQLEYNFIVNWIHNGNDANLPMGALVYTNKVPALFQFYNVYHFDYNGLIPMGLAKNATGLNIY